jgi:hypothetical protein
MDTSEKFHLEGWRSNIEFQVMNKTHRLLAKDETTDEKASVKQF